MNKVKLNPIHSNAKSFYNKAHVINENGKEQLESYNTVVLENGRDGIKIFGYYSNTTARHINEYLMQQSEPTVCKADIDMIVNRYDSSYSTYKTQVLIPKIREQQRNNDILRARREEAQTISNWFDC